MIALFAAATAPVHGTVLVVPGGSWRPVTPAAAAVLEPAADYFRDAGWASTVMRPGEGRRGYADVVAAARRARPPVVLYGQSSGGHLALLAAGRQPGRHGIRAVIADSAPTDLRGPLDPGVQARARSLFSPLLRWSPVATARATTPCVLLLAVRDDRVVPPVHARRYEARHRRADVLVSPPGPIPGVHGTTTEAFVRAAQARMKALLGRVTSGRCAAPSRRSRR